MRFTAVLLALAVAFAPAAGSAQETSPEPVVRAFMTAVLAGDGKAAAGMMHPEALAQFKSMFSEIVGVDTTGTLAQQMFGVAGREGFEAAPAEDLIAAMLNVMLGAAAEMQASLENAAIEYIGEVTEARTGLTFALTRMQLSVIGMSVRKVEVVPLKRLDGEWRIMLTGDIEGVAAALKAQLGGR